MVLIAGTLIRGLSIPAQRLDESGILAQFHSHCFWIARMENNQWIGYAVKRTTNLGGAVGPSFAQIRGNTQNSLTYCDRNYRSLICC